MPGNFEHKQDACTISFLTRETFVSESTSAYFYLIIENNLLQLDIITLKSLEFYGKHGYYDEERQEGNHFELDVIAEGFFQTAIEEDNLDLTFNYEIVKKVAQQVFDGPSEKLIETLCKRIGDGIFKRADSIKRLTVSLRKMSPPIGVPAKYAEITMRWNR